MSSKPKTLDISLMGRTYKVACADEERSALLSSAAYLDRKMNEIKTAGKVTSLERIAVMAALNITHELLTGKNDSGGFDIEGLKRRMAGMEAKLDEVLAPQERLL